MYQVRELEVSGQDPEYRQELEKKLDLLCRIPCTIKLMDKDDRETLWYLFVLPMIKEKPWLPSEHKARCSLVMQRLLERLNALNPTCEHYRAWREHLEHSVAAWKRELAMAKQLEG